jgi:hypothetical protein
MDSVIVFFGETPAEQVEECAAPFGFIAGTITRDTEHFFLWRYPEEVQASELGEEEASEVRRLLGSAPASAFAVSSRHGLSARFALEVVSHLMQKLGPSVLDDDFGNLWSAQDVRKCLESDPLNTIYTLRDCALGTRTQ